MRRNLRSQVVTMVQAAKPRRRNDTHGRSCHRCRAAFQDGRISYSDMQRLKESEAAYQEALQLYRELAKSNSALYQPNVDAIVTALATLAKVKAVETEPK